MVTPVACKLHTAIGLSGLLVLAVAPECQAENTISFGFWANYSFVPDDDGKAGKWGEIGEEAFNVYLDGAAGQGQGRWLYSAEIRTGPGSFTDTRNNGSGNQYAFHKAWVAWQLSDSHLIRVGKSQVPFAWKTYNFWPGDILLAGYGDQMDVGIKLTGDPGPWQYDIAYFLADDWASTSTDTVDDNGHWGSSHSFRKIKTWVGNLTYPFGGHTLGFSVQKGKLEDLSDSSPVSPDGHHRALAVYYLVEAGAFFAKASYTRMRRDLPAAYRDLRVRNSRLAMELGYKLGDWSIYLDGSAARPDTRGSTAGTVTAWAPGARYDYGPGWVYLEYLSQNGFVDRDGVIGEGDFDALYMSMDFYF